MQLFKKRETVIQNMAYIAIMAAINVIFVVLTAVLPPLLFLLVFVLPLISAVVSIYCRKIFYPIYAVVTIVLCLLATSGIYIFDTFFYVIPSIITGFLFGLLVEKKVPVIYTFVALSFVQFILSYLTLIIVSYIVPQFDFIARLLDIFGLNSFPFRGEIYLIILLVLSEIQIFFTLLLMQISLKNIGITFNLFINNNFVFLLVCIPLLLVGFILSFFYIAATYISVLLFLPLFFYQLIDLLLQKRKLIYLLIGLSFLAEVGIFVGCYTLLPHPTAIVLTLPLFVLISCIYFLNNLFIKKTNNDKIIK